MASQSSEHSAEVVVVGEDNETIADTASENSSLRHRSRSAREGAWNFRRINMDDTLLLDDEMQSEMHAQTSGAVVPARCIESSDEDSDCELKRKKKRPATDNEVEYDCHMSDSEDKTCTICFEEFTNAGPHRLVCLKCGHIYGQSCIEKWIRSEKNAKCPQCKGRARLSDIRRIFAKTIKMVDTTELETLKESIKAYKNENENLRIEIAELKSKLLIASETCVRNTERQEKCVEDSSVSLIPSTLKQGPVIYISNNTGCRSVDGSGNFFVITCALQSGLFLPFGLKFVSLTKEGKVKASVPVHSKKPRCCVFSPFDSSLVLSTGEDKTLCVTSFTENSATVLRRYELPANGWSCCWMSDNEIAVGLINGRVLKFNLNETDALSSDLTDAGSRFPVIALHWIERTSSLIVVSIRECCIYRHQIKTSIVLGSIMSFSWNGARNCFMLSFPPSGARLFTEHVLYKVKIDGSVMETIEVDRYRSHSSKQTRMINCALWNAKQTLFSAVFDEAHSKLVVFNWSKDKRIIEAFVPDGVISIKELEISKNNELCIKFRIGCLSESRMHIFELHTACSY
uniref:RING-type E3 ubiquitin transferase n=1 Tax=Syphacia muris TaxID=451379 RepID=A0A0N5ABZ9_9BILA